MNAEKLMRFLAGALSVIFALGCGIGCASRPKPASPYVPPETMYSGASTAVAFGGVMASAVGSQLSQRENSPSIRKAGTALTAAGAGLMTAAIIDAIEVEKEREKYYKLSNAFWNRYVGSPFPDSPFRAPPPPLPEPPFRFDERTSPLSGKDEKP